MEDKVLLGHGSGGTMMRRIIDEVFFEAYAGDELRRGDDAAVLPELPEGARLAFSTDSFVVTPHFFPGGDIGHLAICGTVNDIATSGAKPLYLSCGFILEEGYPIADLKRICKSMADVALEAGVKLVTGDTKVVNKGHGDGVYINTSGIGVVPQGVDLGGAKCQPGDVVLVSGTLGDHGITIMSWLLELCAVSATRPAAVWRRPSTSSPSNRRSISPSTRMLCRCAMQYAVHVTCWVTMCSRSQTRERWFASFPQRLLTRRFLQCEPTNTVSTLPSSAR